MSRLAQARKYEKGVGCILPWYGQCKPMLFWVLLNPSRKLANLIAGMNVA